MAVTLPFSELRELGGYRIAVGLKPTPEELRVQPPRRAAAPVAIQGTAAAAQFFRKPVDSQGMAATATSPTSSAPR